MNVHITGIAGFIGSHLARELLDHGHQVTGADDLSAGRAANVPTAARWVPFPADLVQPRTDVVAHLAAITSARWPDPAEVWESNLALVVHALDGARRAGARFVFASTAAAQTPSSPYGHAKAAAEQLVLAAGGTVLRLANVYGPNQRDWGPEPGVIAAWARATREHRPIRVDGDGHQRRDFIHVADVARAFRLAIESPAADGQTLDVCTGKPIEIRTVARHFAPQGTWETGDRAAGDPDEVRQDPAPAARVLCFTATTRAPWAPGDR